MNEPFDAGLQLNKCAELRHARDSSTHALPDLIAPGRGLPWFRLQLLQAERDLLCLRIYLEDFDLQLLADGKHIFRLVHTVPCDVAYVEQAVHTADVNEGSIAHQAAHRAGVRVTFLHGAKTALGRGASLLFENHSAIDDHVFVGDVELGDAAVDLLADELLDLGGVACAASAGGHKRAHADIDVEAALDDAGHCTDYGQLLRKSFFKRRPVAGLRNLEAREIVVALFVAAGHRNQD